MQGYWQRPDDTAKVLRDGWLATGDIAKMDEDGYIQIVDRKKDMILVSGFNVYPNEVEAVLATHPGVADTAVVGVPDDECGEIVVAFVTKKDPSVTEDAIRQHARQSLTGYKVPRIVVFKDDLPKSNVGKVLRKDLRDEAQRAYLARKRRAQEGAAPRVVVNGQPLSFAGRHGAEPCRVEQTDRARHEHPRHRQQPARHRRRRVRDQHAGDVVPPRLDARCPRARRRCRSS
jgi:hypothetical protein